MATRINGETLPESAVDFELARLVRFYKDHLSRKELDRQMPSLRARARDQAIGARLLIAEARRLDIPVPPEEVEKRLGRLTKDAGGKAAFEKRMADQSLTWDMVRESVALGVRVDTLMDRITADVPDPTEQEIERHYHTHQNEYVRSDRAQVQHILVTFSSDSQTERAVALSKLSEIRDRIHKGADFADQAAAHSDCPSGRKTGGSLGWISRGMLLPEVEQAAFSIPVGAMSDPVESPLGLHLIRKTAETPAGVAEFVEVKEQIRDFLRHARRGEAVAAYVNDLRAKARIEIED